MAVDVADMILSLGAGSALVALPLTLGRTLRRGKGPLGYLRGRTRRYGREVLPGPIAALYALAIGDTRGPADTNLMTAEVVTVGPSAMRWRLLYAGLGQTTLWRFRTRQLTLTLAVLMVGLGCISIGVLPALSAPFIIAGCAALGWFLPLADLRARTKRRQELYRITLVPLLLQLAAFAKAGMTLEVGMAHYARGDSILAREIRGVLKLGQSGVTFNDAMDILAARCNTGEVTTTIGRIRGINARGRKDVAPAMRRLAESTRRGVRQRRKVAAKQRLLRTTAILSIGCLVAMFIVIGYPTAMMGFGGR